jgi:hypothetical protein
MTLRNISLHFELGDTILVGKDRVPAEITKIEYHSNSGEITVNTTQGPRKVLTFALAPDGGHDMDSNPADRYR